LRAALVPLAALALCDGCHGGSPRSRTTAADGGSAERAGAVAVVRRGGAELARFGGELLTRPPPAALDRYYPPATADLTYSVQMEELYRAMNFARHEALRGRWERAGRSFTTFLERLEPLRREVPEWEAEFGTVEFWRRTFGPLFSSGHTRQEAERIDALWEEVRIPHCDNCHQRERPRVIARYHFPFFYQITLPAPDPDDELLSPEQRRTQTVSFRGYMRLMHNAILDLLNFEESGDLVEARRALERTSAYLHGLQVACKMCHALEPRRDFVDPASLAIFADLGMRLEQRAPDRAAFASEWNRGRTRVCTRCHDVHMIAAKLQRGWAVASGAQRPGE
jgi:hypothetical protein